MPDPTPTPTPAPNPAPQPARTRGSINQAYLDELTNSEGIAAAAKKAPNAAQLATGGIDAAKVTAFSTAIAAARVIAAAAVHGTTDKQGVTINETNLMDDLVNKIQEIQKRARQKYDATDPVQLKNYAVGQQFYNSRSLLEQTAASILEKLKTDTLPGITPAKVAALKQALADYEGVQSDQTGAQSDATTARAQLDNAIADIVTRRREIQFAADAEWPHTNHANTAVRVEFQLPPDRVMK